MNTRELQDLFETHKREYLKFEKILDPKSRRPDVNAFLILDALVPSNEDLISCAWHDNIGLGIDLRDLAEAASEDQVIELIRCGVRISNGHLCMFA